MDWVLAQRKNQILLALQQLSNQMQNFSWNAKKTIAFG
jgi:hypothetical protein